MVKKIFTYEVIVYLVIILLIFIYNAIQGISSDAIFLIPGTIGCASAFYVSIYLGLKGAGYRLKTGIRLKKLINKIQLSRKVIILHICIVLIAIVVTTLSDNTPITKTIQIDQITLSKIKDEAKRTDITSIIQLENKYIVRFSDDTTEVIELTD